MFTLINVLINIWLKCFILTCHSYMYNKLFAQCKIGKHYKKCNKPLVLFNVFSHSIPYNGSEEKANVNLA